MPQHQGSCHCGAVTFTFEAPQDVTVFHCNCSICDMMDFQHLTGDLTTYTFGTGVARHTFCPVCGVKPFYVPRSNPDGISINFRCVDQSTFNNVTMDSFDGDNWEANAAMLAELSK